MATLIAQPVIMEGDGWDDGFRLIDSGDGRKLEAYGPYRFVRPETQAMWRPRLAEWDGDGEFVPASDDDGGGRWHFTVPSMKGPGAVPGDGRPLRMGQPAADGPAVRLTAHCTPFRHLGFFPDLDPVCRWMIGRIEGLVQPRVMNMFGYTGVGSLALAAAGATVTHVDASKKSVAQARENAALSGMEAMPIRWIIDDAAKFAARELRRGRRYDGIILDPPKFGRGPEGEVWRLEDHLAPLLEDCAKLLDGSSRFLFLTVYAVRLSGMALGELMQEVTAHLPGVVEWGELAVREQPAADEPGRLLPTAIFARWYNDAPVTG